MFRHLLNYRNGLSSGLKVVSAVAAGRLYSQFLNRVAASEAKDIDGGKFDIIIIGGGSGGVSCARRCAMHGAKVLIIEGKKYGGTCVNVGCVPKKIMFNAAHAAEIIHDAAQYGFTVGPVKFDWATLKASRDAYIARLNKVYESNLDNQKVTHVEGFATFDGTPEEPKVRVGSSVYSADNIVIATGGEPNRLKIPGEEYIIDSDGFFELSTQPKKVAVIGAGYIAVELAGVFNGLGTDTTLFYREGRPLRSFDIMLSQTVSDSMGKSGIKMVPHSTPKEVVKEQNGTLTIHLQNGDKHEGFDVILSAVGRHPNVEQLNVEKVNVRLDKHGFVDVNEWQETSAPGKNIYAVGDVIAYPQLTPVAIATGRRLADRLYGGLPNAKMDFDNVPTVVFSHPPIGTCGMTEDQAICKYGKDNIKIYNSSFVNLWYGPFFGGGTGAKPVTKYKLITLLPDEKVIGLHCIGEASDEVLQGFAVAMKMGATKADFDNAVAIHPTAAEEFVTLPPWGLSPKHRSKFL